MIGIFLMLVTAGAAWGLAASQHARAMNRRIRVPVRDVSESRYSSQSQRAE